MNRNLVGSILGRSSIKIAHFFPIRYQTWSPQAILVSLISKKSSPLKPLGQLNRNFVGSILGRCFIYTANLVPIRYQTWPPKAILVSDWLISKKYNYLCNQCLSPLMLWVLILIRARCTTLCDKVCQWLATGRWFSPGLPVSSTNKTDCQVALNTIKQTNEQPFLILYIKKLIFH
jgi:hypothetical protein